MTLLETFDTIIIIIIMIIIIIIIIIIKNSGLGQLRQQQRWLHSDIEMVA